MMFDEKELHQYLKKHQLTERAYEYIVQSWMNPSRMVGAHAKNNVVSFVPSKKLNGRTFSTESRSPERAFLTLCEFDDEVICALDQPDPVEVIITRKDGVVTRQGYTPDAVVLTNHGPKIVEVKCERDAELNLLRRPNDWCKSPKGKFVYIPARKAFEEFGLLHTVYVYKNESRFLIENLTLILYARNYQGSSSFCEKKLRKLMQEKYVWTLQGLMRKLGIEDITPLIRAIDNGLLVVNLKLHRLVDPGNCLVSSDEQLLATAIECRNESQVYSDGMAVKHGLLAVPTYKEAKHAISKLERIKAGESSRSVRRWKAQVRDGLKNNLNEFQALIPRVHLRGNRKRKIPAIVDSTLMHFIENEYAPKPGLTIYRGYMRYKSLANELHPDFKAVSRQTFTRRVDQLPSGMLAEARGGLRMRNAQESATAPNLRHLKASVPWQCAAVDHCLAKLYLVVFSGVGEVYVERPWITALVDLATSTVLGLSVSFCKPSRRSVAKVLRDCVRRHGKLPREIIVDRGAEFKSVYLASFMAHYGLILSLRPSSHPRYGGEVEGFFGEFRRQWLSQRPGNMTDVKNARSVSGEKTARNLAVLKPIDFYQELEYFCQWRENKCRGNKGASSKASFVEGSQKFPFYAKHINYDSEFIIVTSVEEKSYSFNVQRGIYIKDSWFYTPALRSLQGRKRKVQVRLDPENPNLVFARVGDKWEPCFSSSINDYSAKCPVHQLVEGMIKQEAFELRKSIAAQHDMELAKKIRELDEFREQNSITPVLEIPIMDEEPSDLDSLYANLEKASIRPINVQKWES